MRRVVIFDSGIGGLGVLKEILRQNLPLEITYLADQANFPYGNKSPTWLESRLIQIVSWAEKLKPDALVLACNTATVSSIDRLRTRTDMVIIGVEPVFKPLTGFKHPLILATPATSNSARTLDLQKKYGAHIKVKACTSLASAIEHDDEESINSELEDIADIVNSTRADAIGLSCTHYGLILDKLKSNFAGVEIFDPSAAVVSHLTTQLGVVSGVIKPGIKFYTTGPMVNLEKGVAKYLPEIRSIKVEQVNL